MRKRYIVSNFGGNLPFSAAFVADGIPDLHKQVREHFKVYHYRVTFDRDIVRLHNTDTSRKTALSHSFFMRECL